MTPFCREEWDLIFFFFSFTNWSVLFGLQTNAGFWSFPFSLNSNGAPLFPPFLESASATGYFFSLPFALRGPPSPFPPCPRAGMDICLPKEKNRLIFPFFLHLICRLKMSPSPYFPILVDRRSFPTPPSDDHSSPSPCGPPFWPY